MDLLKVIFGVLIFALLPLGQIAKFDLGFKASITAFDAGVFILVIYWVIYSIVKKIKVKGTLAKPIIAFIIICIFSLVLNMRELSLEQFLVSFSYLFRWGIYAAVYFVVVGLLKEKKNRFIEHLFYSGLILVLFGFIQVLLYPSLKNLFYMGWDEHMYRLFSTFLDPNFAGIYFVIIFFLGLYLFLVKKSKKFLILSALVLVGIFLTYSRTAFVTLLVSVVSFLAISNKKRIIIPIILALLLTVFIFPKTFKSEGTDFFRTLSVNARIDTIEHGLKIFSDRPVFGVGFNSYRYFQEKYGFELKEYTIPSRASAGVENSFVFILATTGLVGFASYLFLLSKMFKAILISKNKVLSRIVFSILVGLMCSALFINSLFYVFIMFAVWLLVGATENS